jgi:hypothetical protein
LRGVLFNGQTGALISALVGANNPVALTNGNFVAMGGNSATWGSGTTGVSGTISATNSLISQGTGGLAAPLPQLTPLANGNYVVDWIFWNGGKGAVTWGNGTTGTTGTISAANSLVGSSSGDKVGSGVHGITVLANGNYVVSSPNWSNSAGAATWGSGAAGVSGVVSADNSLVGNPTALTADGVGDVVTALTNGNYVVGSFNWNRTEGAVTWGNGTTGTTGVVSADNSLVGSQSGDEIGSPGVTALSNGNYVVDSPDWGREAGAVTWGNGATGTVGTVSAANSLVGSNTGDFIGSGFITALANGNYVVASPEWNVQEGAVTWGDGATGTNGIVSADNSLVGSNPHSNQSGFADLVGEGGVTALTNGNYVVDSPDWSGNTGAVTWGNGTTGIVGTVSAANSLVGSNTGDFVGSGFITALTDGNYVVDSPLWGDAAGAVTWGDGTRGVSGEVSAANSLVGSQSGDAVGGAEESGFVGGVTALTNGNYVVLSPVVDGGAGAVTWGNGASGITGTVSSANSLVLEGAPADFNVVVFPNGNYVVKGYGTWVDGSSGTTLDGQNTIDAQNSVPGSPDFLLPPIGSGDRFLAGNTMAFTDPNLLTFALGQDETITVTPGFITRTLNTGTDVTLQASNDITVDSPIVESPAAAPGSLTLQAGRSILVNADIATAGGNLTLIANDTAADGVVPGERDAGTAAITLAPGVTLDTGSGVLTTELKGGQAPAVTAQPASQTVVAGSVVTFTAAASGTPAPAVQWQVSTDGGKTFTDIRGATSTTLTFTASLSAGGREYRAVFSNAVGTATTSAASLTVVAPPVIVTNPTNHVVLAGQKVTFTAAASGTPAPAVQWQVSTDGGKTFADIAGATGPSLTFTAAAGQNGSQYRAVFTNSAGQATTRAAALVVNFAAVVTQQPSGQAVVAGRVVTFTAAASGHPAPAVQWQVSTDGGRTFGNIAGATAATLSFTARLSYNGRRYRAVFRNAYGLAVTAAATLRVGVPPVIITSPAGQATHAGRKVTFTASARGTPLPTVQWQVSTDGGNTFSNIAGATAAALTFTASAAQDGDLFRAVFTNVFGQVITRAARLVVS